MMSLQKTGQTWSVGAPDRDNDSDDFDQYLIARIAPADIGSQDAPQLIVVSGAAQASTTVNPAAPVVNAQTPNQYWVAGKATKFPLPSNTFIDPQGTALT